MRDTNQYRIESLTSHVTWKWQKGYRQDVPQNIEHEKALHVMSILYLVCDSGNDPLFPVEYAISPLALSTNRRGRSYGSNRTTIKLHGVTRTEAE